MSGTLRITNGYSTIHCGWTFSILFRYACLQNYCIFFCANANLFVLVFDGGLCQVLAATSDTERSAWMDSIRVASYEGIRAELLALRQCLERRRSHRPNIDLQMWRLQKAHVLGKKKICIDLKNRRLVAQSVSW